MHEDVAHYTAMAWQTKGAVLELGCGTGRLTLPMARAGAKVVGIDRSEAMLRGCRKKLGALPPIQSAAVELHQGDFSSFSLGRTFPTVLWPFNALHHLHSDEALTQALACIVAHMEPDAVLGMDAYLPDLELYDRDPSEQFEGRTFLDPRTGKALESWEQGWWDAATRIHHVVYHYRHRDGHIEKAHLRFHMWELDELRAAFAAAGLVPDHEASDFQSSPLGPRSLKYVATYRRP